MKRLALLIAALMLAAMPSLANAQGLVTTTPFQATSTISSSSVSSTSVFQTAIAASSSRRGCIVQNTSSNTIYLYIGSITSATTPGSLQLTTKQSFNCAFGGIVVTDQISVTGASGDTYTTVRQ